MASQANLRKITLKAVATGQIRERLAVHPLDNIVESVWEREHEAVIEQVADEVSNRVLQTK